MKGRKKRDVFTENKVFWTSKRKRKRNINNIKIIETKNDKKERVEKHKYFKEKLKRGLRNPKYLFPEPRVLVNLGMLSDPEVFTSTIKLFYAKECEPNNVFKHRFSSLLMMPVTDRDKDVKKNIREQIELYSYSYLYNLNYRKNSPTKPDSCSELLKENTIHPDPEEFEVSCFLK